MDKQVQNSNTQAVDPLATPHKVVVPPVMPPKPPAPPQMSVGQKPPNSKKKSGGGMKVILAVLFSAIIFGGGAFAYQQFIVIEPISQELVMVKGDIETAMMEKKSAEESVAMIQKEIDRLSCNGVWNEEGGCTIPLITLNYPKGNEKFCSNEIITVKWNAPENSKYEYVRVSLQFHSGLTTLAKVLVTEGEHVIPADQLNAHEGSSNLKIRVDLEKFDGGLDKDGIFDTHKEFFSIEKCEDSIDISNDAMEVDGASDEDEDGLTYDQELLYGTNPKIADSDGDGFNDGDEVTNGFNPNGEGPIPVCPGPDCELSLEIPF